MTDTEIAWLAGLLEGEGHFGASRSKRRGHRTVLVVSIEMTDEDVVVRSHALLGLSTNVYRRTRTCTSNPSDTTRDVSRWNVSYRWKASGVDAERIMRLVRPYMGERRGVKIDELLALENLSHHPKAA